jgi:hypothetical protein
MRRQPFVPLFSSALPTRRHFFHAARRRNKTHTAEEGRVRAVSPIKGSIRHGSSLPTLVDGRRCTPRVKATMAPTPPTAASEQNLCLVTA